MCISSRILKSDILISLISYQILKDRLVDDRALRVCFIRIFRVTLWTAFEDHLDSCFKYFPVREIRGSGKSSRDMLFYILKFLKNVIFEIRRNFKIINDDIKLKKYLSVLYYTPLSPLPNKWRKTVNGGKRNKGL